MPITETEENEENVSYVEDAETREFIRKVVMEDPGESVYILPKEGSDEILTEKRMEIIRTLREEDVKSIRSLARILERDVSAVSRDLEILWENDIIEYREEQNRKIPELTTDKIVVEPF